MARKLRKPKEGEHLPDTPDMAAWRKEFEQMKEEDHLRALKELGLSDDDLKEFREMEHGVPPEEELMVEGPIEGEEAPKKKGKKPAKKAKK
jgi:hypothetical protein